MQISDSIFLGNAETLIINENGNPGGRGVGPMGRVYTWDIVPLTLQAAGLGVLQTLGGAGNFTLVAGTGVTQMSMPDGTIGYKMDVPRCVTAASTGDISARTFTVTGYDVYGQKMSASFTGPNNSTTATTKAFSIITQFASDGAVATNTSIGFNDKFGLPFRCTDPVYISSVKWDSTLAPNAGTFVAADATTASPTTTDVRGCYTPAGNASNGTRRLVMALLLPALASGTNATRTGALGVPQNLAGNL